MVDKLIPLAKNLRKRTTDTEQLLWQHLRAKRFAGLKFRRQEPIGLYIVDFVCFEKKLIVELDGGQHALPVDAENDSGRDQWFESPSPQSPPIKGGEVNKRFLSHRGRGNRRLVSQDGSKQR